MGIQLFPFGAMESYSECLYPFWNLSFCVRILFVICYFVPVSGHGLVSIYYFVPLSSHVLFVICYCVPVMVSCYYYTFSPLWVFSIYLTWPKFFFFVILYLYFFLDPILYSVAIDRPYLPYICSPFFIQRFVLIFDMRLIRIGCSFETNYLQGYLNTRCRQYIFIFER